MPARQLMIDERRFPSLTGSPGSNILDRRIGMLTIWHGSIQHHEFKCTATFLSDLRCVKECFVLTAAHCSMPSPTHFLLPVPYKPNTYSEYKIDVLNLLTRGSDVQLMEVRSPEEKIIDGWTHTMENKAPPDLNIFFYPDPVQNALAYTAGFGPDKRVRRPVRYIRYVGDACLFTPLRYLSGMTLLSYANSDTATFMRVDRREVVHAKIIAKNVDASTVIDDVTQKVVGVERIAEHAVFRLTTFSMSHTSTDALKLNDRIYAVPVMNAQRLQQSLVGWEQVEFERYRNNVFRQGLCVCGEEMRDCYAPAQRLLTHRPPKLLASSFGILWPHVLRKMQTYPDSTLHDALQPRYQGLSIKNRNYVIYTDFMGWTQDSLRVTNGDSGAPLFQKIEGGILILGVLSSIVAVDSSRVRLLEQKKTDFLTFFAPVHPRIMEISRFVFRYGMVLQIPFRDGHTHFTCATGPQPLRVVPPGYYLDTCRTSQSQKVGSEQVSVVRSLQFRVVVGTEVVYFEPHFIRLRTCRQDDGEAMSRVLKVSGLLPHFIMSCTTPGNKENDFYTLGALLNDEVFNVYGSSYVTYEKATEWCTDPMFQGLTDASGKPQKNRQMIPSRERTFRISDKYEDAGIRVCASGLQYSQPPSDAQLSRLKRTWRLVDDENDHSLLSVEVNPSVFQPRRNAGPSFWKHLDTKLSTKPLSEADQKQTACSLPPPL